VLGLEVEKRTAAIEHCRNALPSSPVYLLTPPLFIFPLPIPPFPAPFPASPNLARSLKELH